jgi:hypothetical protein
MLPSASIPAVRQNRSKLTETASQALPTAPIPVGGEAINVVLTFFMALLSFVDSTPRAYRLKASNAAPPISTFPGAIPSALPVEAMHPVFAAAAHEAPREQIADRVKIAFLYLAKTRFDGEHGIYQRTQKMA